MESINQQVLSLLKEFICEETKYSSSGIISSYIDLYLALEDNPKIITDTIKQEDVEGLELYTLTPSENNIEFLVGFDDEVNNVRRFALSFVLTYEEQNIGYCDCPDECSEVSCDWSAPEVQVSLIKQRNFYDYTKTQRELNKKHKEFLDLLKKESV